MTPSQNTIAIVAHERWRSGSAMADSTPITRGTSMLESMVSAQTSTAPLAASEAGFAESWASLFLYKRPSTMDEGPLGIHRRFSSGSSAYVEVIFGLVRADPLLKAQALARLQELEEIAIEEEILPNNASFEDFRKWLGDADLREELPIFLLDNGNIRILSRPNEAKQTGLEFLGAGKVLQTVITRDPVSGMRSISSQLLRLGPDYRLQPVE